MSSPVHHVQYGYADYLRVEEDSRNVRHEFVCGEIFAMAGGTREHARIITDVILWLGQALKSGPCKVYSSDLRVRIDSVDVTTYPDASVICGPLERSTVDSLAVVNPVLIVEVTSDSTEAYDRGGKLSYYQAVPSVREILIISHREQRLTLHQRVKDVRGLPTGGFHTVECVGPALKPTTVSERIEPLMLESIAAIVGIKDIYLP